MDTTGSNFSIRRNANRAAKAKLASGIAPAVDYRIERRAKERFEIVWETGPTADAFATGAAKPDYRQGWCRGQPAGPNE